MTDVHGQIWLFLSPSLCHQLLHKTDKHFFLKKKKKTITEKGRGQNISKGFGHEQKQGDYDD